MNIYDYIPNWLIGIGLPFILIYEVFCADIFFNVERVNANALEQLGNKAFSPMHYLFAARSATNAFADEYTLVQKYNYRDNFWIQTFTSCFHLPESIFFGSTIKALSYFFPEVRKGHKQIVAALSSTEVKSNLAQYQEWGIDTSDYRDTDMHVPTHFRRPGSEEKLSDLKLALADVIQIFNENKILFWVDCGTCLGAYRYGGVIPWDEDVDVAVLLPDFMNVYRCLTEGLDSKKYFVGNSSGRSHPDTYLRIYLRQTGNFIDIYHFEIFPEKKQVKYLLSLEENIFLPKSWRIRETRFTHPTDFADIFPLKKASFDGLEVPVPNHTVRYLQARYGENIEPAKIYNPITDSYEKDLDHPYWQRSFVH